MANGNSGKASTRQQGPEGRISPADVPLTDVEQVTGYRCEACNSIVWALVCSCGGLSDRAVSVLAEMDEIPVGRK